MGHGVINQGDCAAAVMKAFFDDPISRPDDRCLKTLTGPKFVLAETDQ
jgi:hypothetical protein